MAIIDGKIRCCDCGESKPLAAFYPSIVSNGCGRCRDCALAARAAAEANDPARFKAYRKAHAARNPTAARASARKWQAKKQAQYIAQGPSKTAIRCSSCGEEKPVSAFTPSVAARGSGMCRACKQAAKGVYNRRYPDRVNAAAKVRRDRNPEETRAAHRAYYRRSPELFRGYNLGRYGISPADYDAILAAQGGRCACCGATANRSGKRLFVDHDHVTGVVRGVLCHRCNAGIGALGDTIEGVRRALSYLERAQKPPMHAAPALRINLLQGAN